MEERGWAYRRRQPEGTVLYEVVSERAGPHRHRPAQDDSVQALSAGAGQLGIGDEGIVVRLRGDSR